jgi:hypothetical protein
MNSVKRYFQVLIVVGFLIILTLGVVNYYSYIFSRRVIGVIDRVEKVQINVALMQNNSNDSINPQLYSFAVAIKEASGEIVTASSEDRQWAVVQAGQCAEAVYYPYPPWRLDKANTYFGARLEKLSDCAAKAQ